MKESHSKGNDECNVDKFWSMIVGMMCVYKM